MLSSVKNIAAIFVLFIGFSALAEVDYAKEGAKFAQEKLEESKKLDLEKIFRDAKNLETPDPLKEGEGCKDCKSEIKNIQAKETDIENGILAFVSFSMPEASLKQLNDDAQKRGATLVLRGLHEGSFVKTKDKILSVDKNGLVFELNPELFKKLGVERVPTFILLKEGKEINRLSGNVSLEYAASKLEKK